MHPSFDLYASLVVIGALAGALAWDAIASASGRLFDARRVSREEALPLVGRRPMLAVYRPLSALGRALVAVGVRADPVTASSLVFALVAAIALACGHFGLGALLGSMAALADAVDGIVARESHSSSRFGQALDTLVDRYVDALLLGGLAVHVRDSVPLLVVMLGAMTGSFMVSYASSIERELGPQKTSGPAAMRRAHRLAYLLFGVVLAPLVGMASPNVAEVPVTVAALAIAVIGNYSAVRRILRAARSEAIVASTPAPEALDSETTAVQRLRAFATSTRR